MIISWVRLMILRGNTIYWLSFEVSELDSREEVKPISEISVPSIYMRAALWIPVRRREYRDSELKKEKVSRYVPYPWAKGREPGRVRKLFGDTSSVFPEKSEGKRNCLS